MTLKKVSTFIIVLWVSAAVITPILPLTPNAIHLEYILEPPGFKYILGSDDLGRSILERLLIGAHVSLVISFSVVLISLVIGTVIGVTSGYLGGWVDLLVVRIMDVFLAFPGILLAIALAGIMGPGIDNVIIALVIFGWVGFARLARAQTLMLKSRDHVLAAIGLGTGPVKIILFHLLPLAAAPLIVEATFGIASVVVAEASLSFLGLGVQPPFASWGSMIRDGTRYLLVAPHLVLAPGLALMLVVLAINLFGDLCRDRLDVK